MPLIHEERINNIEKRRNLPNQTFRDKLGDLQRPPWEKRTEEYNRRILFKWGMPIMIIISTPLVISLISMWAILGIILTTSTFALGAVWILCTLGCYIPLQVNMGPNCILLDWPIVLSIISIILIFFPKKNNVQILCVLASIIFSVIRHAFITFETSFEQRLGDTIFLLSIIFPIIMVISDRRIWCPATVESVEKIESLLYKTHVNTKYEVNKIAGLGTVKVPCQHDNPINTLVLLHGYGAGNAFWAMNLAKLSENFNVYAVEWMGVGRSDRPTFTSETVNEADAFFIGALEKWREKLNLNKFILAGHSLGAMLSSSYAIKYPMRVHHLILLSPVGVGHRPERSSKNIPLFFRFIRFLWNTGVTPMSIVRFAGPLGPALITLLVKRRVDWMPECSPLKTGDLCIKRICEYTYHNWALRACGEYALHTHLVPGAYAKEPLCEKLVPGKIQVPVTFIYGGGPDWMDSSHGMKVVEQLQGRQYAKLYKVPLAGHQVFMDNPTGFNDLIVEAILECDASSSFAKS